MKTATTVQSTSAQVLEFEAVIVNGQRKILRADSQHLCRACGQRRARFFLRGTVRADRTHTLCFECYQAEVNQARVWRRVAPVSVVPFASPMPAPARLRGESETFYRDVTQRLHRAQIAARHAADGLTGIGILEARGALQKVS